MNNIYERMNELYNEFVGFPNKNSIVRRNTLNDAFTLVVFEVLFHNFHGIRKLTRNEDSHLEILQRCIVPPPDDGIDIFYEEVNLGETHYHIVQVKYSCLTPQEIYDCFVKMRDTLKKYSKKTTSVGKNLKKLIGNTEFSLRNNNCTFYVAHEGNTCFISNQASNQKIITNNQLLILSKGAKQMSVPKESFAIDTINNFIINEEINSIRLIPKSFLCNISGYDLAKLNNDYSNTILGRNILYGQNLRESLSKKSKTFDKMLQTIDKEPELFLYYNNGITILCANFDAKTMQGSKEYLTLSNFSIINGAQTASTLGYYLQKAEEDRNESSVEKLKKVYVLAKVYEINNQLKDHENISEKIKIFTNTQTPLSTRDMVSIREEQIKLQDRLLNEDKNLTIFVDIKKGTQVPDKYKIFPHQKITNEEIAQLSLCGFLSKPWEAKDKKAKIFDIDTKTANEDCLLNSVYDSIFNPQTGILFEKTILEIDELLFIYRLHEDTKKEQKKYLKQMILDMTNEPVIANQTAKQKEETIISLKRAQDITSNCLFFNITCYFELKKAYFIFNKEVKSNQMFFDYKKYYQNKEFKDDLITDFNDIFFSRTVEFLQKNSNFDNIHNWVRSEKNQDLFLKELNNYISTQGRGFFKKYESFLKSYKIE